MKFKFGLILTVALALASALSSRAAQPALPVTSDNEISPPTPPLTSTVDPGPLALANTNPPPVVSEALSIINFLGTTTSNWAFAPYLIYDTGSHTGGGGLAALYTLNDFMAPCIRIEYLGREVSMVSGTFTLQVPIKIMGTFTAVPFGFGGINTPLAGLGEANGRIDSIYGLGLAVRTGSKSAWLPDDIVVDWERRGNMPGNQFRFGGIWKIGKKSAS